MNDVARQSGLSRPTLYRYFVDREALNRAVLERHVKITAARVNNRVAQQPNFDDKVVEGLVELLSYACSDQVVLQLTQADPLLATRPRPKFEFLCAVGNKVWRPLLGPSVGAMTARDSDDVVLWLSQVALNLLPQSCDFDGLTEWENVRRLVRKFVLPAFQKASVATQRMSD